MILRGNISLQQLSKILRPVEVIIIISTNDSYIFTRVIIILYIHYVMLIELSNNKQQTNKTVSNFVVTPDIRNFHQFIYLIYQFISLSYQFNRL